MEKSKGEKQQKLKAVYKKEKTGNGSVGKYPKNPADLIRRDFYEGKKGLKNKSN